MVKSDLRNQCLIDDTGRLCKIHCFADDLDNTDKAGHVNFLLYTVWLVVCCTMLPICCDCHLHKQSEREGSMERKWVS